MLCYPNHPHQFCGSVRSRKYDHICIRRLFVFLLEDRQYDHHRIFHFRIKSIPFGITPLANIKKQKTPKMSK